MPQSAASEVELVQGLPSNGDIYRSMRPSSDHNKSTIDFNSSSLPSTTSSKSGSSADNAISIASTPAAEPSSERRASTPLASQVNSRSGSFSSLCSLASDEEEDEDEDYAPWDTAGAGQGGKISKPAGSTSSKKTSVLGGQWSEEEDAILVKAVDRCGTKWKEVSREFNRLSKTTRSNRAVEARWRLIVLGDKGKAPIMLRATSSLNAQQVVPTRPFTFYRAKRNRQRSDKRFSWGRNEVAVLRESLNRHRDVTNDKQALYRDFYTAFPKSARTRSAIRNMCSKLLRGWDLPEEDEEDEEDEATDGEEGSVLGDDEEESGSFAASKLTAAASRAEEDSEVAITYMSNGLIIEDLPPHYHIKVYSPTRVKVGRKSSIDTADPPAFHVKSLNDGSIEAITLPEGTTKTVLEVLVEGSQGDGVVTESTYLGLDAYTLLVRTAL